MAWTEVLWWTLLIAGGIGLAVATFQAFRRNVFAGIFTALGGVIALMLVLWIAGLLLSYAPRGPQQTVDQQGTRTAAQPAPAKPGASGEVANRPPAQPQGQATPPAKPGNGVPQIRDLNVGESIPAGTLAIVETVDFGRKTIHITAGNVDKETTERVDGNIHTNVWANYPGEGRARADACMQGARRKADPEFAGFTITVNPACPGGTDAQPSPAAPTDPGGTAVNDGQTVKTGTIGVYETVNWQQKTVSIFGGRTTADFVVKRTGSDTHRNAWTGFVSVERAQRDACTQAEERRTQPEYAGFRITVTSPCTTSAAQTPVPPPAAPTPRPPAPPAPAGGKHVVNRITSDCATTNLVAQTSTVVYPGAEAPAGAIAEVRQVFNGDAEIYIEYGCLPAGVIAGKDGLNAIDVWWGFSTLSVAYMDSCTQALGDSSQREGTWNYTYKVFLWKDGKWTEGPFECKPTPAKPVTPPAAPTPQK